MSKLKFIRLLYRTLSLIKRFPLCWTILSKLYSFLYFSKTKIIVSGDHKFEVNIKDKGIGQRLYFIGYYGVARINFIKQNVKPGDTVLDIGANIGYFTMELAKAVGPTGTVIALEPDDRNFQSLKRNIELNGYSNIKPYMHAVSDEDREAILYKTSSQTDNALVENETGDDQGKLKIQVVKLDSFLPSLDIHEVDFIKIDTDGSEPLAIIGMAETIKNSPNFVLLTEYTPVNLKRYLENPMDFLTIAKNHQLELKHIFDTETGEIDDQTESAIEALIGDENYDLIFRKVKTN